MSKEKRTTRNYLDNIHVKKLCICCIVTKKKEDYFDRNEINTYLRILNKRRIPKI